MSDPFEPVMRCQHESRIDEMNARMLLFHPALARATHDDKELREACFDVLFEHKSFSETLRSFMELEEKGKE